MGKPYSDDLRGRVIAAMCRGMTCREAGEVFNLAPSTTGNWYRRFLQTKSYSAHAMGGDQRSKLNGEAEWIASILAKTPDLTLTDVRHKLSGRGIKVGYSSVWRTVHRLGLRFKKNDIRQ